jgi:hypothetical protein
MKGSLRYRLIFLALALLLGFCLFNPTLLVTYLVDPLTRIAWLIIRTFLIIDQDVYWVLLIFVAFLLVLRILPARQRTLLRQAYDDTLHPEDRVAYWEGLLDAAEDNPDARSTLQQELAALNQNILSLAEGYEGQAIDLPSIPGGALHRLPVGKRALILFQRLLKPGGQPGTVLEKRVASILKTLEDKLEIKND